jgi:hypothetical protein
LDEEAEAKRQQKEADKQATSGMGARAGYRGAHRGEGEENEENKYEVEQVTRSLDDYLRVVHKNTEFFSTYDPNSLFEAINGFAQS